MPDETPPISVVYIEDDAKLGRLTTTYLERHGLLVDQVADPREGIAMILRKRPDVVLLDLMLPGIDGFEVCRKLREKLDTPILMVTALGEEADRVMGLEGGADDYIAKPFSSRELLARIRAQARRAQGRSGPRELQLSAGRLTLDTGTRTARLGDASVDLTTYEFDLLCVFVERPGRAFSREQLVKLVRGHPEEAFERSIDVHISHLRKKLGDDPRKPSILKTVRGIGYMFAAEGV